MRGWVLGIKALESFVAGQIELLKKFVQLGNDTKCPKLFASKDFPKGRAYQCNTWESRQGQVAENQLPCRSQRNHIHMRSTSRCQAPRVLCFQLQALSLEWQTPRRPRSPIFDLMESNDSRRACSDIEDITNKHEHIFNEGEVKAIQQHLLQWFDANQRVLPWRTAARQPASTDDEVNMDSR